MARQSLVPQRVKNTGIDLLIAGVLFGGSLVALSALNKRFGIVNKAISGAGSLGTALGQSVGTGLANIPAGLAAGFLGQSQPSTGGTGQVGTNPQIAQQNLRDNLTLGGLLDPSSQNYLFGGTKTTSSNPNPNNYQNVSPNASNPPGTINPKQANANLPLTSPSNPPALATQNRANIITTIKSTTSLPSLNTITPARDARANTLLRGQPLPINLQNAINTGVKIQTAVINTAVGGIREVAGSPALIQRLAQNLRSSSR